MKRAVVFGAMVGLVLATAAPAGTIVSWGSRNPVALQDNVPEGDDFKAVAAGDKHSLALREDGTVVGWGANNRQQITIPADVVGVKAIAAGKEFSMALLETGAIRAWGYNNYSVVSDVPAGNDFVAIAAAANGPHAMAMRADGSAVAWGYDSPPGSMDAPEATDYLAVGCGAYHNLAVRGTGPVGAVSTWGLTYWGLPLVPAGSNFKAVVGGYSHSLALRQDGTLAAWGIQDGSAQDYGQVTGTPTDAGYKAIAAGDYFSLALKTDGSLAAWGQSTSQQTTVPAGNSYVAIAAGAAHGVAIWQPGNLQLLMPNGGEQLQAGTVQNIMWVSEGGVSDVVIEYSTDNGQTWAAVSPANEGNTGAYEWLVPQTSSEECLVRVTSATLASVTDVSDAVFSIIKCPLKADLTGDCKVDMEDLAVLASEWMFSASTETNPSDFNGSGKVDWVDLEGLASHWLLEDAGIYNLDGTGSVDMNDFATFLEDWGWRR